jgi:hypothetical protein
MFLAGRLCKLSRKYSGEVRRILKGINKLPEGIS